LNIEFWPYIFPIFKILQRASRRYKDLGLPRILYKVKRFPWTKQELDTGVLGIRSAQIIPSLKRPTRSCPASTDVLFDTFGKLTTENSAWGVSLVSDITRDARLWIFACHISFFVTAFFACRPSRGYFPRCLVDVIYLKAIVYDFHFLAMRQQNSQLIICCRHGRQFIASDSLLRLPWTRRQQTSQLSHYLNPQQPKVFRAKFSLRGIGRFFPIKIRNFKLWKMPELIIFSFPEG